MSTVLIRQRRSRRNRHLADPSMRPFAAAPVLTFVSAAAGGFTVSSNIPLVLGDLTDLTAAYNASVGGHTTITGITLLSPTSALFATPTTAVGGTLTITGAFRGLRTAQGGLVEPGTFHA